MDRVAPVDGAGYLRHLAEHQVDNHKKSRRRCENIFSHQLLLFCFLFCSFSYYSYSVNLMSVILFANGYFTVLTGETVPLS